MADLVVGIAVVLALSAVFIFLGLILDRRLSKLTSTLTVLALLLLMFAHNRYLRESVALSRLLPFSNLIVISNWFPLFGGMLCGIAWRRIPGRWWRRCALIVPLFCVSIYSLVSPLLGPTPIGDNIAVKGVSLQTSRSSCSAACAATLLRAHGIPATEGEMIPLCLTHTTGTALHGLFRGLKLKTAGTRWDVRIVSLSIDELLQSPAHPRILSVRLDDTPGVDERYKRDWGWLPGVQHSVVFFGKLNDRRIEMGDPAVGRELWGMDALKTLWRGDAMELVPRE